LANYSFIYSILQWLVVARKENKLNCISSLKKFYKIVLNHWVMYSSCWWRICTLWAKKRHPFHCGFYKCWQIFLLFGTYYTELLLLRMNVIATWVMCQIL